jgi:hypothetical protein
MVAKVRTPTGKPTPDIDLKKKRDFSTGAFGIRT